MLICLKGLILSVAQGMVIEVEVEHRNGFPGFELVGLPDKSVKESKERVSEAIKNSLIDLFSLSQFFSLTSCSSSIHLFSFLLVFHPSFFLFLSFPVTLFASHLMQVLSDPVFLAFR